MKIRKSDLEKITKEKIIRMTPKPSPVSVRRPRIRFGIIAITWNKIFIFPSTFFGRISLNSVFSFNREDIKEVHMRPDIFRAGFSKMKYKLIFKLKDDNRVVIAGLTPDSVMFLRKWLKIGEK
ncbi:MAG: hypothetical protein DRN30_01575 [Thermoplasmata archaeon]|nr:hypothetical protein [Euryarchaeota archaeon]RLF66753.1 MAG: hypothetical protein DRN30_01575 [Thermoplasmata archaeon]